MTTETSFSGIKNKTTVPNVKMLIDGLFLDSKTKAWFEIRIPATQELLSMVPCCTFDEVENAIQSAKEAFYSWRELPVSKRMRIFLKF